MCCVVIVVTKARAQAAPGEGLAPPMLGRLSRVIAAHSAPVCLIVSVAEQEVVS